jgi:hypothetical protein
MKVRAASLHLLDPRWHRLSCPPSHSCHARQAKDSELIQYATEIKVRAERRCGELLAVTEKRNGGHAMKARSHQSTEVPQTLSEMGLTRDESSRYQQLAPNCLTARRAGSVSQVFFVGLLGQPEIPRPGPIVYRVAQRPSGVLGQPKRESNDRLSACLPGPSCAKVGDHVPIPSWRRQVTSAPLLGQPLYVELLDTAN